MTQGKEILYSTEYTYIDLAVDTNGLWAIYAAEQQRNFLLVSKLDADRLTIQKTWNISVQMLTDFQNSLNSLNLQ